MNLQAKLRMVEIGLAGSRNLEAQGHLAAAAVFLQGPIIQLLSIAVKDHADPRSGIAFLQEHRVTSLIEGYIQIILKISPSDDLGVFGLSTISHVASLMDRHDMADCLILRPRPLLKDFWAEYHRAMSCLVSRTEYEPRNSPLQGWQKYWFVYLPFVSDITRHRCSLTSLEAIRQSFCKQNQDKRLSPGGLIAEGCGRAPSHWDFRAEALKRYAQHAYGLSF